MIRIISQRLKGEKEKKDDTISLFLAVYKEIKIK